jgi:hypothetical protein
MRTTIDPVAVEHVRCCFDIAFAMRGEAKIPKKQQQVAQLAMDVAEDFRRHWHVDQKGLRHAHTLACASQHTNLVSTRWFVYVAEESFENNP